MPTIKLHKANEWRKLQAGGYTRLDLACTMTEPASPEFIFGTGALLISLQQYWKSFT